MLAKLSTTTMIGIGIAIAIISFTVYWSVHMYNNGAASEVVKQEKALDRLEEKTDAVQDRALTTTTPRDELRKYSRPE